VLVKTVYSYFVTLIINRGIEMSNDYSDLAIQATPKQIQQEKDNFNQALLIFKNELANKSFTKLEMLPELVSLFKEHLTPFYSFSIDQVFRKYPPLTLEEKKFYGLNTRKKYASILGKYFHLEKLHGICPKDLLQSIYFHSYWIVCREVELKELRGFGIKKVSIFPCNDERDCKSVKELRGKVYAINEVPILPLKTCDASYCRCSYLGEE
jgi:hypothetical protein